MALDVVDSDALLVREHLEGKAQAFDVLYRRYFPRLVRHCTRLTRDLAQAEDIAQETLVRAHAHLERFDRTRPMWPWLKTIASRLVVDHVRAQRRQVAIEAHLQDAAHVDPGSLEEREVLALVLSKLPARQRTAFALRYIEGWDSTEAAQHLGLSALAFRQILHRARRRLQAEYRKIGEAALGAVLVPVTWFRRVGSGAADRARHLTSAPEAIRALAAVAAVNLIVGSVAVFGGAGRDAPPSAVRLAPPSSSSSSLAGGVPDSSSGSQEGAESAPTGSAVPPRPSGETSGGYGGGDSENIPSKVRDRGRAIVAGVADPTAEVTEPEDAILFAPTFSPAFPSDRTIYAPGTAACATPQCPPVLFRSTDGGTSWVRLEASGFDGRQILLPPAFGAGDDRIFAIGPLGLDVSEDGGLTFNPATPAGFPATGSAAISPRFNLGEPMILLGDQVLMRYRDDLKTTGPSGPVPGRGPMHPVFSPSYLEDGLLFVGGLQVVAGRWQPAVFRCLAEVCSGSPLGGRTTQTPRIRPAPDFAETGVVYAFLDDGVFVSEDRGASFAEVVVPWDGPVWDVAVTETGVVLAAVGSEASRGGDLYSSADGGRSWDRVTSEHVRAGVSSFRSLRASGSHVIATLQPGGILCSADAGRTWAPRCPSV